MGRIEGVCARMRLVIYEYPEHTSASGWVVQYAGAAAEVMLAERGGETLARV
jgi:hypothetical protein